METAVALNLLSHKIKAFQQTAPYTLEIVFDDNKSKTINFFPVLHGEMYGPLRNADFFHKVSLDKEVHTLIWPNGADFDPVILYNWEQNLQELVARAQNWK